MTPERVVCPVHSEFSHHCDERHMRIDRLTNDIFSLIDAVKSKAEANRIEAIEAVHTISMRVAKIVGAGVVVQLIAAALLMAAFTRWFK